MTKITFRPDQAAVASEMLDVDKCSIRGFNPIAPLNDDRALVYQVFESQARQLSVVFDSVKIDVRELHAAWVHTNQLKRRARHGRRRADSSRDTAHEGRLSRAELTGDQYHIT